MGSGGGECTGLNSIRMFCGLVGEPSYIAAAEPYYEGPFGDWHSERLCNAGADIHYTSDSVWGPFVSCPQETVMCGFQTKGYTAFPYNNEIFRVRFLCCDLPPTKMN